MKVQAKRAGLWAVGAVVWGLVPGAASAHFVLDAPASWWTQDGLGDPQKLGPCGNDPGGNATGTVTPFRPGETITVTIDEKIPHPGHYRISLSVNDRSELPAEPVVTPNANYACGTAVIEANPVFPVLADNVFPHTAAFNAPQSVQITLPSNISCTHCTLQILEFMSQHPLNSPGGCYYHHCADISILAADAGTSDGGRPDAGATPDAGGPGPDAGRSDAGAQIADAGSDGGVTAGRDGGPTDGADGGNSPPLPRGCGCAAPGGGLAMFAGLLGSALLLRRRRPGY